MSKEIKNYVLYLLVFLVVVSFLGFLYFSKSLNNTKMFYQHIGETRIACIEQARKQNINHRFCNESWNAAIQAYSHAEIEVENSRDYPLYLLIILLLIGLIKMKYEINELKKLLND